MPLSLRQTRAHLDALAHMPNKKLGQNFLIDGNIVRKSIEMAALDDSSCVVEVGPGLGTLTRAILDSGARVWAVERDSTLAAHLRAQLVPQQAKFHLTEGDCLEHPRAGLPAEQAESGYKIVANLPYAVATPWMEAVITGPAPQRMVLMLQKEAADRYTAAHGSKAFGAISIFLQSAYRAHSRHLVAAQCFHPAPKVDSALLRLDRREDAVHFSAAAREAIRTIFTQRRKQLGALCKRDPRPELRQWFDALVDAGVKPTIRPEELPIEHWQALADQLN